MTCGFGRRPAGFAVRCGDGEIRHEETFATYAEASHWLTWGHFCYLDPHKVVKVSDSDSESTASSDSSSSLAATNGYLNSACERRSAVCSLAAPSGPSRTENEDEWTGIHPSAWGEHPGIPVHFLELIPRLRAAREGSGLEGKSTVPQRAARNISEVLS